MSTTLSVVLHVVMAGPGRDVNLPTSVRDVSVVDDGGEGGLDPLLRDFWSAFPCPPPWNHALLFRVNWTACVGQAVGERLKWFLADRCNIPHDGTGLLPGGDTEEEMEAPELCSVACIIMISLAALLFALLIAAVVFCVCRKRPKNSSPTHQSSLAAHPDNAKYYTSCHYASAPVMPRPLETTLCGNRTDTHVTNGTYTHQLSPYHQQMEHHPLVTPHHHHHHHHLPQCSHNHLLHPYHHRYVSPPNGSGIGSRQGDLPLPPSRNVLSYRRLEGGAGGGGDYTSSSTASQTNSDRSHTYESISEGQFLEGLKNGLPGGGMAQTAGSSAAAIAAGAVLPGMELGGLRALGEIKIATPDFCDCDCVLPSFDPDPTAQFLDGYYSDRSSQTIPGGRHYRHVIREQEASMSSFGGPYSFDIEDSPLHVTRPDSRLSNRSRKRMSSGSHYSDRSFGAQRGGEGMAHKRSIPALHPNYFDPPEPPAPDTFTS